MSYQNQMSEKSFDVSFAPGNKNSLGALGTPKKTPHLLMGRFWNKSLTMTYFHTGIRTIIGAKAFHCPVRDGKEWYHFAMVVRHNFLSP